MKKVFLAAIFASVSVYLTSCGSTNVASTPEASKVPETAQEAVTQKHEEVANDIASEINAVSPKAEPQEEGAENGAELEAEPARSEEPEVTVEDEAQAEEPEISESAGIESEDSGEVTGTSYVSTAPSESVAQDNSDSEDNAKAESQAEPESEESSEKVSEEDSKLDKEREQAPTTDEKNKVAEYQIFEEPEIIVHDLPEPKEEEQKEEPAVEATEEAATEEPESEEPKAAELETEPAEQSEPQPENTEPAQPELEQPEAEQAEPSQAEKPAEPEARENISQADDVIEEIPVEAEEPIVPSRSVKVKMNQYLDVTYPGTGWTYIGEEDKNDVFNYFGRKLGTKNTTFSLRAKKAGKTILHFYKNDALTGEYIDDYLEVVVEDKKGTGRVKAPSYAEIIPAKPQRRIDRANENAAQNALPAQEEANPQIQTAPDEVAPAAQAQSAQAKTSSQTPRNNVTKPASSKEELKKPEPAKHEAPEKNQKAAEPAANPEQPKGLPAPKAARPLPGTPKASSPAPLAPQESAIKTVIENKEATTHVKNTEPTPEPEDRQALRYTPPVSSQSVQAEEAPSSSEPVPLIEDTSVAPDESLLEKAKKDFEDKKFADALKEAQEYYNSASTRLDEALFLLGQICESNSTVRDIRFAVDSYDMLVKRYPTSKYWKQAKNRSIYLKRFYIDIR